MILKIVLLIKILKLQKLQVVKEFEFKDIVYYLLDHRNTGFKQILNTSL